MYKGFFQVGAKSPLKYATEESVHRLELSTDCPQTVHRRKCEVAHFREGNHTEQNSARKDPCHMNILHLNKVCRDASFQCMASCTALSIGDFFNYFLRVLFPMS